MKHNPEVEYLYLAKLLDTEVIFWYLQSYQVYQKVDPKIVRKELSYALVEENLSIGTWKTT